METPAADQLVNSASATRARRPVDAIFLDDGQTLCVANQRSGSVSFVDVTTRRVLAEFVIGDSITSLATLFQNGHVLAVDAASHELIHFVWRNHSLHIVSRMPVSAGATTVAVSPDGLRATVAALWSHCLDVIEVVGQEGLDSTKSSSSASGEIKFLDRIELPFPPRLQCFLDAGTRVLITDGFGGQFAVVDLSRRQIVNRGRLTGHNIRGIVRDAKSGRLMLANQVLNQTLPTSKENIERGKLMQNVVTILSDEAIRTPQEADVVPTTSSDRIGKSNELPPLSPPQFELGKSGAGAADPTGMALLNQHRLAVALSGVNELAVVENPFAPHPAIQRLPVGGRPVAVVQRPGTPTVAVVNMLDDTISLIDLERKVFEGKAVVETISLGSQPASRAQDRGERLFFDARLSRDGWLSCHSCHPDGHSNGLLADTLADNTEGTPKRTLTLMGTANTYRWGWNGGFPSLHDQVLKSQVDTLHGEKIGPEQVRDLVGFLHTLPVPPPVAPASDDPADVLSIERGRRVFESHDCQSCHVPPLIYASHESRDVGLRDEKGLDKFSPPSLRGVSQGWHFFHDNRAPTLESVFTVWNHPGNVVLNERDLKDLVRFLKSL